MGMLSAAVGGAGEGMFSVGRQMVDYGSRSALQDQANEAAKLRDARLEEYASAREKRGYEHSEALQKGGFAHAENLQASAQDFQSAENFLTREQQSSEGVLNRSSHERIAKLGRDAQTAIASMHGTVQVGQDGKILWVGPEGKVIDTGYSGPKDLSGTAKVAADIIRDQLKGIDKSESDGSGNPQQIAQQRTRLQGQLLAVLSGDLEGAFKGSPQEPPPAIGTVVDGHRFLGGNPKDQKRWKPVGSGGGGLLNTEIADVPPGQGAQNVSQYVNVHRGGATLNLPARSMLSEYNGKTFANREEAEQFLRAQYGYQE